MQLQWRSIAIAIAIAIAVAVAIAIEPSTFGRQFRVAIADIARFWFWQFSLAVCVSVCVSVSVLLVAGSWDESNCFRRIHLCERGQLKLARLTAN